VAAAAAKARLAVLHVEQAGRVASPAVAAVVLQDLLAKSGEPMAGMRGGPVAPVAKPRSPWEVLYAGAERGALDGRGQGSIVQQNNLR